MKNIKLLENQRGDTIVEVAIALAILSITLFNAYSLSNQSAQLGLSAREKAQATQLAQHQADALRNIRDNTHNWEEFQQRVRGNSSNPNVSAFHMVINNDEWAVVSGVGNGNAILGSSYQLFSVRTTGVFTTDRFETVTTVTWEDLDGSNVNVTLDMVLVNFGDSESSGGPLPPLLPLPPIPPVDPCNPPLGPPIC